jgi:hypothetical protein
MGLVLASLVPLALCACGFHPLYGKHEASTSPLLAGVQVDPIPGRMGQQLREALEDHLNPSGVVPPHPAYRLSAEIASSEAAIDVSRDGTVSRYNVYLDSKYTLYRNSDGQKVTTGTLRQVGSYSNLTNAYFSTYVSDEDAIKQGIIELGEIYRERLAAYLSQAAEAHPTATN